MAFIHSPRIITDGLQLLIDPKNTKSYSPNVFSKPTDVYGWCGDGGGATYTRDTIASPVGNTPLKMVVTGLDPYTATYGSAGWNIASSSIGESWTTSAWIKASANTSNGAGFYIFGCPANGQYGELVNPMFNITTEWQRYSYTYTMTVASTKFIQLRLDGVDNGIGTTIWYDGLQLERGSSMSQFSPIGNTTSKLYDLSGNSGVFDSGIYGYLSPSQANGYLSFTNNGTLIHQMRSTSQPVTRTQTQYTRIGWFYLTSTSAGWSPIIQNSIGNNSDMGLTVSGGKLHFRQYSKTGTNGTTDGDYGVSGNLTVGTGQWYMGAIVVNLPSNTVSFYLNDKFDSTQALNVIGNSASDNIVIGGCDYDAYTGDRMFKGNISLCMHYNRLLSHSEIVQNFNAQRSRFGI